LAALDAIGVKAGISVPLIIGKQLVVNLTVQQDQPRAWTDAEVELVEEVAERTWAAVERARAEAALQDSARRFRALVTAGAYSVYRMSPDWRLMYQLGSDTLADTTEPIEDWIGKYTPEEDLPAVQSAIAEAIGTKSLFELEHRVRQGDGSVGWVRSRAVPLLDANGEIEEWFGAGSDVSARKQAELALRESEERYRSLFETIDEAYAVVEVLKDASGTWADFRFLEVNPAFLQHTSIPDPVGKTGTELLGTRNLRWARLYGQAVDTGEAVRVEEPELTLGPVFDLNIFALDRERNRVAVLFSNITERKRAEQRQRLLLAELQHRVRNILAMIRSVARRTADNAEDVTGYWQHLEGRITAMARTQELLTREVGAGVDLQNYILDELEAQAADPCRFTIAGPDVSLPAKPAEVLALAVHELATNSVKYGALSANDGRIDVRWGLLQGDDAPRLSFIWSESGVEMKEPPSRRGFGRELITERVPYELQGIGTMEFTGNGVTATIEFPLIDSASSLQTDADLPGSAR